MADHRTLEQLEAELDHIRSAPSGPGVLELIVRRPVVDARETLSEADLDLDAGLVGDNWASRSAEAADPDRQVTLMNARVAAAVAGERRRWALAGDQLYVDLDLSVDNLPVGSRLSIGEAVVEVTAPPHLGCAKFRARFGTDAVRFVNARHLRGLRLRGCNTRVVVSGRIRAADTITVLRAVGEPLARAMG